MKKFIITGAALVALAVPAVASADADDHGTANDVATATSADATHDRRRLFAGTGHGIGQRASRTAADSRQRRPIRLVQARLARTDQRRRLAG